MVKINSKLNIKQPSKNKNSIVLQATELNIGYNKNTKKEITIHKNLNFKLLSGKLTCLIGPNGAGKSTLLRTIANFQPSLKGSLILNGKEIYKYKEKRLSRIIGVVLTDRTQCGGLTVFELASMGRIPYTGFFGNLTKKDNDIITNALKSVDIYHKKNNYVSTLSDGERQRVMIAKAIAQECPIIILDEPTAFLDISSRIEVMALLHNLAYKQNKAIILSTHDIEQALVLSDNLWLMNKEKGLRCGFTEDMVLNNQMQNLFPDKKIKFNISQGFYYHQSKLEKEIIIYSNQASKSGRFDTKIYSYWLTNALNKIGYKCIPKTSQNHLDTKDKQSITLQIKDEQLLFSLYSPKSKKTQREFQNIEEIVKELNSLK